MKTVTWPYDPKNPPTITAAKISGRDVWYVEFAPGHWWVWLEHPIAEVRYVLDENNVKTVIDEKDPRYATANIERGVKGTGEVVASTEALMLKGVKEQLDGMEPPVNVHDVRRERDALLEGLEFMLGTSYRQRLSTMQIEEIETFFDDLRDVTEGHDKNGAPITGELAWPEPPAFVWPHLEKVVKKHQLRISYSAEQRAS